MRIGLQTKCRGKTLKRHTPHQKLLTTIVIKYRLCCRTLPKFPYAGVHLLCGLDHHHGHSYECGLSKKIEGVGAPIWHCVSRYQNMKSLRPQSPHIEGGDHTTVKKARSGVWSAVIIKVTNYHSNHGIMECGIKKEKEHIIVRVQSRGPTRGITPQCF